MKKLSKRIGCVMLAGALGVMGFAGCGKEEPVDGSAEAMKIKTSVNMGAANFFLRYQQATTLSYYAMFGMDTSNVFDTEGEDGKTTGESTKESSQDTLEEMYLLKEHMGDYEVLLVMRRSQQLMRRQMHLSQLTMRI